MLFLEIVLCLCFGVFSRQILGVAFFYYSIGSTKARIGRRFVTKLSFLYPLEFSLLSLAHGRQEQQFYAAPSVSLFVSLFFITRQPCSGRP